MKLKKIKFKAKKKPKNSLYYKNKMIIRKKINKN
jgi:hypothetical protein